jgi:hypothetical protein
MDTLLLDGDLRTGGQKPVFDDKTSLQPLNRAKKPVSLVFMRPGIWLLDRAKIGDIN